VAGITGQAYIDGAGSTWNLSNAVYVGYQGVSELLLSNGGSLTVAGGNGTVYLGYGAGSSGDLLIGNDGGPGGFVNAATVTTLSGMGTLDFETTNTVTNPYYFTKDGTAGGTPVVIAGATSVNAGSGYNVLNGANTYTGGTTILGGTLVAGSNGALGTGSVTFVSSSATLNVANGVTLSNALNLTNGGTLTGNGTIATPVAAGFGVFLSPGNSPGTLTFSNGLTLASGGTLTFQVQQAGGVAGVGYDLVNLTGGTLNITAIPTSRFTISVQSLDGTGAPGNVADFSSSSGYVWTIFSSSGGITGFNANEFTIDTSGFANSLGTGAFYVVQSGNQIQLDFSPVPEPSTYALFAAGLGLVGFVIRRRRLVRGG
jgi:T5SS/PEP-CTERM-associated repeat protein/autotransporter-associated beta strand protein